MGTPWRQCAEALAAPIEATMGEWWRRAEIPKPFSKCFRGRASRMPVKRPEPSDVNDWPVRISRGDPPNDVRASTGGWCEIRNMHPDELPRWPKDST